MASSTSGRRYATDLTDGEWAILGPLLAAPPGRPGRPRRVDLRAGVDGRRYQGRTGCRWRLVPAAFPYWGPVGYYFDRWTWDGTLARLNDGLRRRGRQRLGRDPEPRAGALDSQTAKTTEAGGERGFDGGNKEDRAHAPHPGGHGRPADRARRDGGGRARP